MTIPFDPTDTIGIVEWLGMVPETRAVQIPCTSEDQWLDARRQCVGASEVPIILGESTFTSPYALWYRKKLDWRLPSTERMRWGHLVEDPIAELFIETRTNSKVFKPAGAPWSLWRDVNLPWMICTPDRLVVDADGVIVPLEIKSDEGGKGWGETGSDVVPRNHRMQVLWQAHIFGAPGGFIARKRGSGKGSLAWYWVPYEAELVGEMISAGAEFLFSIDHDRPPEPDGTKATTQTLQELNPAIDENTESEVGLFLYYEWLRARREKKDATAAEALASNRLRAEMGRAQFASVKTVDGFLVPFAKRSIGKRAGYSVPPGTTDRLDQIGDQRDPLDRVSEDGNRVQPEADAPDASTDQAVGEEVTGTSGSEGVEMGNGEGGGAGEEGAEGAAYTCPFCGWVSHNPNDALNRYCGHCHKFADDRSEFEAGVRLGREMGEALKALAAKDLPPELAALVERAIKADIQERHDHFTGRARRRQHYRPVEVAAILDQMHAADDAHRLREEATRDPGEKDA